MPELKKDKRIGLIETIELMQEKQTNTFIKQIWKKVGIPLIVTMITGIVVFILRTTSTLTEHDIRIQNNTDCTKENKQRMNDMYDLFVYGQLPDKTDRGLKTNTKNNENIKD